jgi:hypothetical protein
LHIQAVEVVEFEWLRDGGVLVGVAQFIRPPYFVVGVLNGVREVCIINGFLQVVDGSIEVVGAVLQRP